MKVVSRKEAISLGLKRYFTGKPCKRGHVVERFIDGACVICRNACSTRWQNRNREKIKAYNCSRREEKNAYQRRWNENNSEKRRVYTSIWRSANPSWNDRRLRQRNAGGRYTAGDIAEIFRMQRGLCAVCRTKLKNHHVDHIIPIARGGTSYARNLQLLCQPCNSRKSFRDPIEYMQSRGYLL